MKRIKITISGRVQGVGFRPAIYRYALQEKLKGFVLNTNDGVVVEVEGKNENINSFLKKIKTQSPKLSRISRISVKEIESKFDKKFIIKKAYQIKKLRWIFHPIFQFVTIAVKSFLMRMTVGICIRL